MQKINNFMKKLLDKETQTLVKADFIDGNLYLTDEGRLAMWSILFEANKAALVALAQEKLDEEEKAKK